ncbi:hypothetical protein FE257_012553 [Aspergillus nanangensis]|uniref:Uncharacterized protein n=1 Tax=Aspergillus nanangensis TaxID=2582783 RepID=A0AAD4GXP6_ASPNN|nr:hypothetical protein FE257_012553 [Aspergillus nanangensis]
MRTRSQQASPGGFVSLENNEPARRTRSNRSASQSNADPSAAIATESTARPKSQRTTKKPGPKKSATTKTQNRKVTKRGTRRTTRQTSQALSGDEEPEPSDENAVANTKYPEQTAQDGPEDTESTTKSVLSEPKTSEREFPSPIPSSEDPIGPRDPQPPLDPQIPQEEGPCSPAPRTPPESSTLGIPWREVLDEISDIGSPLSERSRTPSIDGFPLDFELDGAALERLFQALDMDHTLWSDVPTDGESSTPELFNFELDEVLFEQLCLGLDTDHTTLSDVPIPANGEPSASDLPGFELDQALFEQICKALDTDLTNWSDVPANGEPSTSELAEAENPTTEFESVTAEKPSAQSISIESSCSAPVVNSVEDTAAVEELEALIERLSKLSLTDETPCSPAAVPPVKLSAAPTRLPEMQQPARETVVLAEGSTTIAGPQAAVVEGATADTPRLASIYDDAPPYFDNEAFNRVFSPPAVRVQQSLPTTLGLAILGPIPSGPTSIFEEGQAAFYLNNVEERQPVVGRPLARAELGPVSTPTPSVWPRGGRTRLSPIPEETEMSPGPAPGAGKQEQGPFPPSMAPMVGREENEPTMPNRPPRGKHEKTKKLTPKTVNRKRSRSNVSTDNHPVPETPPANKRRNLGTPGSTPFARRLTPLSRRLSTNAAPYSERLRRRAVEDQGRIHRTVFRIPELIAQTEADRRASESSSSASPFPEHPTTSFNFTVERDQTDDQNSPADSSTPQESSNPETPRRGWNIRGLLSSVPRSLSISRFLPAFGRSPGTPETSVAVQPSSERITRTQRHEMESGPSRTDSQSRRRLSESTLAEERPKKRSRNMSYSLFPAPMDKSLYLGDIPKAPKETQKPSSSDSPSRSTQEKTVHTTAEKPQLDKSTAPVVPTEAVGKEHKNSAQTPSRSEKKRKRAPSPDVIPNPVGSSYGMDLAFFGYSSDSDEEASTTSSQGKDGVPENLPLTKSTVRNAIRSERHPSKKVRFDASPEDTPSKKRMRGRATDTYSGQHFVGMGSTSPSPSSSPSVTPTTPTPPVTRPPGFIPNTQGTFQLDYDAFSDDSESSGAPSPSTVPAVAAPSVASPASPSVLSEQSISTPVEDDAKISDIFQPSPFGTPQTAAPPSTPGTNKEALARARLQAEKYKPKTPSGLRTASRYSSPMTATPDSLAHQQQTAETFGDDQFARDAQWLYENCPSGDLKDLVWPAKRSLLDDIDDPSAPVDLVANMFEKVDKEAIHESFKRNLDSFQKSFA